MFCNAFAEVSYFASHSFTFKIQVILWLLYKKKESLCPALQRDSLILQMFEDGIDWRVFRIPVT
jgi:hypothetical protein